MRKAYASHRTDGMQQTDRICKIRQIDKIHKMQFKVATVYNELEQVGLCIHTLDHVSGVVYLPAAKKHVKLAQSEPQLVLHWPR